MKRFENYESIIAAFFIDPNGKVISTNGISHISTIIADPQRFGLARENIQAVYSKHGEKMGIEGKARIEIIKHLIAKGWIRLRRYPNMYWSIQVTDFNKQSKDFLYDFSSKVLGGIGDFKELDAYMPVKIACESGIHNCEIGKISSGTLYTLGNSSVSGKSSS